MGKFEVYRDKAGEFRFRLLTLAGDNIMASEGYREKRSAFNGIASIKKNSTLPHRFMRKKAVDGRSYFVLKAGNHEIIGKSKTFDDDEACETAIRQFIAVVQEAEIDDVTKRMRRTHVA
ncbi:MAG: YegP family protein [Pseudomonadota bacterium]